MNIQKPTNVWGLNRKYYEKKWKLEIEIRIKKSWISHLRWLRLGMGISVASLLNTWLDGCLESLTRDVKVAWTKIPLANCMHANLHIHSRKNVWWPFDVLAVCLTVRHNCFCFPLLLMVLTLGLPTSISC